MYLYHKLLKNTIISAYKKREEPGGSNAPSPSLPCLPFSSLRGQPIDAPMRFVTGERVDVRESVDDVLEERQGVLEASTVRVHMDTESIHQNTSKVTAGHLLTDHRMQALDERLLTLHEMRPQGLSDTTLELFPTGKLYHVCTHGFSLLVLNRGKRSGVAVLVVECLFRQVSERPSTPSNGDTGKLPRLPQVLHVLNVLLPTSQEVFVLSGLPSLEPDWTDYANCRPTKHAQSKERQTNHDQKQDPSIRVSHNVLQKVLHLSLPQVVNEQEY